MDLAIHGKAGTFKIGAYTSLVQVMLSNFLI
jgi:hypothetical protein